MDRDKEFEEINKKINELLEEDVKEKKKRGSFSYLARGLALLLNLGLVMVVCVLIGFFIGRYIDNRFGTGPIFLLVFTFIGLFAALKAMYDLAMRDWKK